MILTAHYSMMIGFRIFAVLPSGQMESGMMFTPAIVVIAYNRADALKRLLNSIEEADYPQGVSPELVISIDKSDSDSVAAVAEKYNYSHGRKTVIARKERLGLRNHVLACGDLTEEYGSIIVLEDDLFVSPAFYGYAQHALEFADKDDRIGAVSLYNHLFNVHKREAFCAIDDGYDNWYLQMASSWGQAYTKKQWEGFRKWYEANKDTDLADPLVPANVTGWSDRSWLKYYIVYLIRTGKYALYPRVSLTTNFGDQGTHACKSDTDLQVPLCGIRKKDGYDFSTPDESNAVYDSFFEPLGVYSSNRINLGSLPSDAGYPDGQDILVDLYGYKPVEDMISAYNDKNKDRPLKYVLSSRLLPYVRLNGFGRQMRPVDANIVYNVPGNDLHLYDITKSAAAPAKEPEALRHLYEYRAISASKMIEILKYRIREKFTKQGR